MFTIISSIKKFSLIKIVLMGGLVLTSLSLQSFAGGDKPSARESLGGDELDPFLARCARLADAPQERKAGETPSFYAFPHQEDLVAFAKRLFEFMRQHPSSSDAVQSVIIDLDAAMAQKAITLNKLWGICIRYNNAVHVPDADRDSRERKMIPKAFRLPEANIPDSFFRHTGWRASTLLLLDEMDSGLDGRSHPSIFGPAFIPLLGTKEIDSFERLMASLYNIHLIRIPGEPREIEGRFRSSWGVLTYDMDSRVSDRRFLSLRSYVKETAETFTEPDAFVQAYASIALEKFLSLREILREIIGGIKGCRETQPETYFKLLLGLDAMLYSYRAPKLPQDLWEEMDLNKLLIRLLTFKDREDLEELRQDDVFLKTDPHTGHSSRSDAEISEWICAFNSWIKACEDLTTEVYRDPLFIRIKIKTRGLTSYVHTPTLLAHRNTVMKARQKLAQAGIVVPEPELTGEGILKSMQQTREAMVGVALSVRDYALRFIEQTSVECPESLKTRFDRRMVELNEQEAELKKRFTPRSEAAPASAAAAW